MQNSLPFYSDFNSYPANEAFLSNVPDSLIENDVFGLCPSNPTNSIQMPTVTQPTLTSNTVTKKRKKHVDPDVSYSPSSIYSDNSNYSDASYRTYHRRITDNSNDLASNQNPQLMVATSNLTTSAEEGSSDDNNDDEEGNDLARKREKHTKVEAQRRALEKAHFRELSMLITDRNDSKSSKLHHLDLLKIAADQIIEMNSRHAHDPLRPSNLTDNELNFLTIEASNAFLFVTTIEPSLFRIMHVTDSINHILHVSPDQWRGENFLTLIHPEDVYPVQNKLMQLGQRIGMKVHFECRLKQGHNNTYPSVVIDGMAKMVDNTLTPLTTNTRGFLAFIGVCHLPLIKKYSDINMSLYKDHQSTLFRCRCSPHDWKIFLIDNSVTTLQPISNELFRSKSILDFIPPNEHGHVHQALLQSTASPSTNDVKACHFVHPTTGKIIPMSLKIKSIFNHALHRADFIELTFTSLNNSNDTNLGTSLFEFINDNKAIDELFEHEPMTASQQQTINTATTNNNNNITTAPYYYSNNWTTKNELL